MGEPVTYSSVKDAIEELRQATLRAKQSRPATVQLPPVWAQVHAREEQKRSKFVIFILVSVSQYFSYVFSFNICHYDPTRFSSRG